MTSNVVVAGVSMVKFQKPGRQEPYRVMASKAIIGAVEDAGIPNDLIEQAYAAYVYGDSTCGQHALYDAFMTGIPVINVNNNCSSGSAALFLARQAVESGSVECALAFGFEEMTPGPLMSHWSDRESPFDSFLSVLDDLDYPQAPLALRCFGAAGDYYLNKYDASSSLFAKVSVKTRGHAVNNPLSLFDSALSIDQVLEDKKLYLDYLTRTMCCPPTCGAAAAIVCSKEFAKKHGIDDGVHIAAQAMTTDKKDTWDNPIALVGAGMTARAAEKVFNQAGVDVKDVDVVELHDCFTVNEVLTYEALGLCGEGESTKFVDEGNNTYGGEFVVNPSGGLMSKGHPLGATGLAQCFELVTQLRGHAGDRQVPNARLALQHNLGLGGAAVITLYQKK